MLGDLNSAVHIGPGFPLAEVIERLDGLECVIGLLVGLVERKLEVIHMD